MLCISKYMFLVFVLLGISLKFSKFSCNDENIESKGFIPNLGYGWFPELGFRIGIGVPISNMLFEFCSIQKIRIESEFYGVQFHELNF